MSAVITIALPVFAIIAAGFVGGRLNFVNGDDVKSLNKFVFQFAMPAALFGLTATTPPPGANDISLALSYALAAGVALFGGYFLSQLIFGFGKQEAGAHGFSSTLGNAVFLGLPIALTIEGWARPFVVLMLIEGIFVIAIGAALMSKRDGQQSALSFLLKPLRNPLVAAVLAGFLLSAMGLPISGPLESFFSILGRAAGPTALFSLGLFLATHQFPKIETVAGRVTAIAVMKMMVLPAIALGLAFTFGIDDAAYLGALALFVFVPSGVGTFVMASQYKVYETEAAAAVLVTTLLSVVTISGVLILFA